ncbi:hypothetical protein GGH92_000435, partial [Coemansia sp. RSA 2673]
MSNQISAAQRLPLDVLRLLVQYVASKDSQYSYRGENIDKLQALLYVCSTWRQAALEYSWKELSLKCDSKRNIIYVDYPLFAKNFKLPNNAPDLVKSICIT